MHFKNVLTIFLISVIYASTAEDCESVFFDHIGDCPEATINALLTDALSFADNPFSSVDVVEGFCEESCHLQLTNALEHVVEFEFAQQVNCMDVMNPGATYSTAEFLVLASHLCDQNDESDLCAPMFVEFLMAIQNATSDTEQCSLLEGIGCCLASSIDCLGAFYGNGAELKPDGENGFCQKIFEFRDSCELNYEQCNSTACDFVCSGTAVEECWQSIANETECTMDELLAYTYGPFDVDRDLASAIEFARSNCLFECRSTAADAAAAVIASNPNCAAIILGDYAFCSDNETCAEGTTCIDDFCFNDCSTSADCGDNESCENHACRLDTSTISDAYADVDNFCEALSPFVGTVNNCNATVLSNLDNAIRPLFAFGDLDSLLTSLDAGDLDGICNLPCLHEYTAGIFALEQLTNSVLLPFYQFPVCTESSASCNCNGVNGSLGICVSTCVSDDHCNYGTCQSGTCKPLDFVQVNDLRAIARHIEFLCAKDNSGYCNAHIQDGSIYGSMNCSSAESVGCCAQAAAQCILHDCDATFGCPQNDAEICANVNCPISCPLAQAEFTCFQSLAFDATCDKKDMVESFDQFPEDLSSNNDTSAFCSANDACLNRLIASSLAPECTILFDDSPCLSDEDCEAPLKCDTSAHTCRKACTSVNDCDNASEFTCENNTCIDVRRPRTVQNYVNLFKVMCLTQEDTTSFCLPTFIGFINDFEHVECSAMQATGCCFPTVTDCLKFMGGDSFPVPENCSSSTTKQCNNVVCDSPPTPSLSPSITPSPTPSTSPTPSASATPSPTTPKQNGVEHIMELLLGGLSCGNLTADLSEKVKEAFRNKTGYDFVQASYPNCTLKSDGLLVVIRIFVPDGNATLQALIAEALLSVKNSPTAFLNDFLNPLLASLGLTVTDITVVSYTVTAITSGAIAWMLSPLIVGLVSVLGFLF